MSEQLLEIFRRDTFELGQRECDIILVETGTVALAQISDSEWKKIRYLCVFGKDRIDYRIMRHLSDAWRLSHDGLCLISSLKTLDLDFVIRKCGKNLTFMAIDGQHMIPLDLSPMKQLRYLYIGRRTEYGSTDIRLSGLKHLTVLETLWLYGSFELADLDLSRIKNLKYLTIGGRMYLDTIRGLSSLRNLKQLSLSGIEGLRNLDFSGSRDLEHLHLEWMHDLSKIPALDRFQKLRSLAMNSTAIGLTSIDLSCMRLLEKVDLSENHSLEEIRGLERLDSLTHLDISNTSVRWIPDGIRGKPLKTLCLSELELEELPHWLPELELEFSRRWYGQGILLWKTRVNDVDMSIFDQSQEMILRWFAERKVRLNEIKVVFLGDGEAGKSHTIARLMNDGGEPIDYTDQSTPGIVIKNKEYDLDGRNIRVHYWDFGGQEILHSMHRIFLTERTLYVVLVNARDETQDNRARYWLHNIRSFANNAPVILVLNKIDQNPKAKFNEPDLRSKYPNLRQVISMSALKFDQAQFNREFTEVLLREILATGYLDVKWPIPWTQVKGELENMATNYIKGAQYREICQRCDVDQNEKDLLHWFNDLGVCYRCDDYRLKDYMILRPDWITNALYIILFNNCPGARNGLIPHESIARILGSPSGEIRRVLSDVSYTWDEIRYVLEVFHNSGLSFSAGGDHEFIPMLCDPASTPLALEYEREESTLEFRMEFDYLPNNLLHQLMVERQTELRMAHAWRTGAVFTQPGTDFSAVVTIDGDILRFFVRSAHPMHRPNTYLTMLKANVDRIRQKMGLKEPRSSVVYKRNNAQDVFDYEMLNAMIDAGQKQVFSMTWRRMLEISDIMNQSAPEEMEQQEKLLDCIIRSCLNIQGDKSYIDSEENRRNTRMRDDLTLSSYTVRDQTLLGSSGSGKNPGELDLAVYSENGSLWTIIEALRIRDGSKTVWNEHLEKLLGNYNAHGQEFLFLVTYVDDECDRFSGIWEGYQTHIRQYGTDRFRCVSGSYEAFTRPQWENCQYIRTAQCRYDCGGYTTTVYHIFVRIGQ